jgi:hypothetical protein
MIPKLQEGNPWKNKFFFLKVNFFNPTPQKQSGPATTEISTKFSSGSRK